MNIEEMVGYPRSLIVMRPHEDANLTQMQGQISALTKSIQDLTLPKEGKPQFWCT
jgi:hypothetical protein